MAEARLPALCNPKPPRTNRTHRPSRRQGTQWVPSALISLSLRPCHRAPWTQRRQASRSPGACASPRAIPGPRGPTASSSGGPTFRPRLAGSLWPVHSSLPTARLAARPHRVPRSRTARPAPFHSSTRSGVGSFRAPHAASPHAAAYWCLKRLLGTRHVPCRHSRRRGRAKMTSQDPGAARRGEAEDEGDRLKKGRRGRSSCSNPEARGSQHSPVRLRGTRSLAQAWVPVTVETVSPGKIGCFPGLVEV